MFNLVGFVKKVWIIAKVRYFVNLPVADIFCSYSNIENLLN